MSKKKKRGGQSATPSRQTKRRFGDVLAQQLQQLDVQVVDETPAPEPATPAHQHKHHVAEAPPEPTPLTDEELFAQALDGMSSADIYRGKFQGEVQRLPAPPPEPVVEAAPQPKKSKSELERDEARAREAAAELREQALFSHVVGPVDRMGGGKYHVPQRDPNRVFDAAPSFPYIASDEPEGWITPTLPKSGDGLHHVAQLVPSQRELIRQAQRAERERELPALNLRGELLDDAMRQLELFVHQHWRERERYVRLIHGRGLQSDDGAVIKPAVLRWLEGPGFRYVRGCAPEVAASGDYGSLIVALKPREDTP